MTDELEQLRARVKELETERDDARARLLQELANGPSAHEWVAANADRARLREALGGLTAWLSRWRHAVSIRAEGASQAWDELERLHNTGAALASTDASEWLRERRLAERVREACAQSLRPKDGEQDRAVLTRIAFSQGAVRATDLDALLKEEET